MKMLKTVCQWKNLYTSIIVTNESKDKRTQIHKFSCMNGHHLPLNNEIFMFNSDHAIISYLNHFYHLF